MSKTLKLNAKNSELRAEIIALDDKETALPDGEEKRVVTYTRDQLLEMLRALPHSVEQDSTVDLPTGDIPKHLIADKSSLPPADARASVPVQPPPKLWGQHIAPSPIQHLVPDPRTGFPANQAGVQLVNSISPPPSRNFR